MNSFINKIGLDKIAHFGIGGVIFAAITAMFTLANINLPLEKITFGGVLSFPIVGYVIVMFLECAKEYIIDEKPDWKDIIATFAGCVFVHIFIIIGYLLGSAPANGLINSICGWIVFGIIMLVFAGVWIYWAVKSMKK